MKELNKYTFKFCCVEFMKSLIHPFLHVHLIFIFDKGDITAALTAPTKEGRIHDTLFSLNFCPCCGKKLKIIKDNNLTDKDFFILG